MIICDENSEDVYQDVSHVGLAADDDDDDLNALIRETVAKRDKKDGTKLLKKTKGSKKIAKGETGGGSFQSMGKQLHFFARSCVLTSLQ